MRTRISLWTTLLAVAAFATASAADAAVYANTGAITINDSATPPPQAAPYPSTITVSGEQTLVTDVNVTLNGLGHSLADDVDILLVGPGGQAVMLMSDAGGADGVAGLTLTFDDAAAGSLPN